MGAGRVFGDCARAERRAGQWAWCLVVEKPVEGAWLAMNGQSIDEGGAGFIQAQDLDVGAGPAKFEDDFIESIHGGEVPEVGVTDIDDHMGGWFFQVKAGDEFRGGGEEDVSVDGIRAGRGGWVVGAAHANDGGHFAGEEQGTEQHADADTEGEIVGPDDHDHGGDHD